MVLCLHPDQTLRFGERIVGGLEFVERAKLVIRRLDEHARRGALDDVFVFEIPGGHANRDHKFRISALTRQAVRNAAAEAEAGDCIRQARVARAQERRNIAVVVGEDGLPQVPVLHEGVVVAGGGLQRFPLVRVAQNAPEFVVR